MSNTKSSHKGSVIAFIVSALLVLAATWMFLNRQHVLDQVAVWSFAPSSDIIKISERVEFTDKGQFVFYATAPIVANQEIFNKECPRQESRSPILGCYTNDDSIYVYDITNETLDGMEEVTAAHEMLHAAWYRISEDEKAKLGIELRAAYEKLSDDKLSARMDYYERTQPTEINNELHSILGTEVESLGEPLESYYSRYFNRPAVLKLHQQYSVKYNQLYDRADEIYSQMEDLSVTIQDRSRNYDTDVRQLSADIAAFNRRANNNGFSTQSQFNTERSVLLNRTEQLDAERNSINNDINTYNGYYSEYQHIAKQIEVLNNSLDSFKQIEQAPSV